MRNWTPGDLEVLRHRGIAVDEAERQLAVFAMPPAPLRLERPCALGDGIRLLEPHEHATCLRAYEKAREAGRLLKFVPASGAASRMFADLAEFLNATPSGPIPAHAASPEVRRFITNIDRFAFVEELRRSLAAAGLALETLIAAGDLRPLLEHVLGPEGLGAAALPKGLLPFHRYTDGPRTAFEEHLVEAAQTVAAADARCPLHFTVSPEHQNGFETLLEARRAGLERRFGVRFDVSFSSQKPSTDTLAVDTHNQPWRDAAGSLLLRPGGHGALLENLNDLQADLVAIKNIDNVTVEQHLASTLQWKRLLGGILCLLQEKLFAHVSRLSDPGAGDADVELALRFARDDLQLALPAVPARGDTGRRFLLERLQRPLRVCGMVRNRGEPGGGPFWVRGGDGLAQIQIVERAQIDPHSLEQQRIFAAATHFSPVDIVCGVRDRAGRPFDLHRFVDRDAAVLTEKSSQGRKLRVLEHPGLWNGGMAAWLTVLVEVPDSTFNPVKTVMDLLRPAHQAG